VRLVAAMMDLTERKRLEQRLLLADRMASMGTLAAGVAHEINNPLAFTTANLGFVAEQLSGIAEELPPGRVEELASAVADAQEGAERVRMIVRDLRTFSRPDDAVERPIELHAIAESVLKMTRSVTLDSEVVIKVEPTPRVLANEARLGQVLLNLIMNAAQSAPEGKRDHRIELRMGTATGGEAEIAVADNGVGMPREVLARIFDPFYTTKPLGVGTGLGLPVCHGIVTALGGSIEVKSTPGVGTVFRVLLPPAPDSSADYSSSSPLAGRANERCAVLVIDDEPMIGTAVRRALKGHDVLSLSDATEALGRIVAGARFDVILSDLLMPSMTGMQLHEELSRVAPEQAARMVFVSGGASTPSAQAFLARVPNIRLDKPFTRRALHDAIARVIGPAPPSSRRD
jgi:nitrogen-specific signal transduction histidine kinase/CheY-like chemotaxis protein